MSCKSILLPLLLERGEEIKITLYAPLIPTFSLKGEGAGAYVDFNTTKPQPFYY